MISERTFLLMHLLLVVVFLLWIGVAEWRGRGSFRSLNRGVRYRRMTTAVAMKRIRKGRPPAL